MGTNNNAPCFDTYDAVASASIQCLSINQPTSIQNVVEKMVDEHASKFAEWQTNHLATELIKKFAEKYVEKFSQVCPRFNIITNSDVLDEFINDIVIFIQRPEISFLIFVNELSTFFESVELLINKYVNPECRLSIQFTDTDELYNGIVFVLTEWGYEKVCQSVREIFYSHFVNEEKKRIIKEILDINLSQL